MTYAIELKRSNVTPAKFFAEIRFACRKKDIPFCLELAEFANPSHEYNSWYTVVDGKKISYRDGCRYDDYVDAAPCKSEAYKDLPYEYQTYILEFNGSCISEICEFTFDNEKTGHGYYYHMNRDVE